jgi:hypothetical protein
MGIRFQCRICGEWHDGMPTFGWPYPVQYVAVPAEQRDNRTVLTSDTCTIDSEFFFIRGCIEIPVAQSSDPFSWGVWVSLREKNFRHYQQLLAETDQSGHGPFFGWLASHIWLYPDTLNLKTMVHLRDGGVRPYIELEPTGHPLAVEQREGITVERVAEIYGLMTHPPQSEA